MNHCRALRRCAGVSISVFLFSISTAFSAFRQPVDYDISVGFGGIVPDLDRICPVTVTIDNQIGGTSGEIQLTQPDPSGGFEVTHCLPFASPSPSVKRFTLPVRLERGRKVMLTVRFQDHIKTIQRELKVQRASKPLVLCIGVPNALKVSKASEKYRFLNIPATALPDDPILLDGAHAVMFSGLALASLDKGRTEALREWAAGGGRLIAADCPPDDTFTANFSRLTGASQVSPAKKGIYQLGAGLIACAGTDVKEDIAFWEGNKNITASLFPKLGEKEDEGMFSHVGTGSGSGHFTSLWKTKRTYGFLAFASIVLIVGAYIAMIGPVDWWLVRRMRKPYLTWFIFIGAIGVFSLLAYSYSHIVNVGAMRMVQVNVLDTSLESDIARGNSQFWVYSAKNTTYRMATPRKEVAFSARESALSAGLVAGVRIRNGVSSEVEARIPIFSSKEFDAAWYTEWDHRIICEEKAGILMVTLPEELKAKHIFIADDFGVTTMQAKDGRWVAELRRVRWEDAIWSYAQSLGSPLRPWASRNRDTVPQEKVLLHYLMCMSFPWQLEEKENDWQQLSMFRNGRNSRETAMDIRYRLERGRVLMIFLDGEEHVLPVSFARNKPKTVCLDLIRMQIPETL